MMNFSWPILVIVLTTISTWAQQGASLSTSPSGDTTTSRHHGHYLGRLQPIATDSVVMMVNDQTLTLHPGAGSNLGVNALYSSNFDSFESQVSRVELAERDALVKRDTAALRSLWQIDFTAGNTQSRKLNNRGLPFPYYESFNRIVEKVTMSDGVAYANGVDIVSASDKAGGAAKSTSHKFIHVWKLFGTQWKMISRFPNDY